MSNTNNHPIPVTWGGPKGPVIGHAMVDGNEVRLLIDEVGSRRALQAAAFRSLSLWVDNDGAVLSAARPDPGEQVHGQED